MPDTPDASAPARIPALCALATGVLLSALSAVWLHDGQERAWEEEVRKLAQDRAEVIRGSTGAVDGGAPRGRGVV